MRRLAVLLAVAVVAALVPLAGARANGVPQKVQLAWLPGLSNYGPQDAAGEAEVSYAEASVRVRARGLPQLHGSRYELWLVRSSKNVSLSAGKFNANADGTVDYAGTLHGLDNRYDWDLVILTVEPNPDPDPAPSDRRSIGGYFQLVQAPSPATGSRPGDTMPATLPQTGGPVPGRGDIIRLAVLWGTVLGGIAVVVLVGRTGRKGARR